MMLSGMRIVESAYVPSSRWVETPPRNKREARKRTVISRRRKRAGKPLPRYGHMEEGIVFCVGDTLLCAPGMAAKIMARMEAA